jgi:transcriptional regulator
MMAPPARQLSFGDEYMPKFNWRSLDDTYYDHVEEAEMTGIAWECLRRNASFEEEYQTISSSGLTMDDGFRQHWGLVFRS